MENRLIELIDDYQENQRRYHQNIQQLIDILERVLDRRYPVRQPTTPEFHRTANNGGNRNRENLLSQWIRYYITNRENNDMQDVIVRPTEEEIIRATQTIVYDRDENNQYENCPITLEPFQEGEEVCKIRQCSHTFKKTAIMDWFTRNVRCPVCRYDIRDYQVPEEETISSDTARAEQNHMNELPRNSTRTRGNNPLFTTLQNTLQNIFTQNMHNLPFQNLSGLGGTEENESLLYTFDIPLYFDYSGNNYPNRSR